MTGTRPVAVLKFGGTSVATSEQRAAAIARIRESRQRGFATVAVVSAMGRAPAPYATDSLAALAGHAQPDANVDLLLSCGETIAAALTAYEACLQGVPARALTGTQAGIITDGRAGDATPLRVEAAALSRLLDAEVVPIVAGFQGATADGTVTTLGRGGSDLSAIAIGQALGAERIDIYTDVPGVMTADPRRIEDAHPIERVSLEEMIELSQHGAKVMHDKAAEFAQRSGTRYELKSLRTDEGTIVDDHAEHRRPVSGIALKSRITWFRAIRGDVDAPQARMQLELEMFSRIAHAGISLDQVSINQGGVSFGVQGDRGNEMRELLGDLNLAVRVREGCAKLSVVGAGMRGTPGVVYSVVSALSAANVEIIHCTDSNITISVLVPEIDAQRAERAVHDYFHLDEGVPAS
ncbi:MAG: aspartate kinase [Vulcanimicrobiaceae bacterium]